ncbi:unnamed protein product [Lampetra fluviatilis]
MAHAASQMKKSRDVVVPTEEPGTPGGVGVGGGGGGGDSGGDADSARPKRGGGSTRRRSTERRRKVDVNTSLLRAARAGNLEKVLELLKAGTDIHTTNQNGLNALHLAAKEGHVAVVKELLTRGSEVDSTTKKGNTALHIASLAGQTEVVTLLTEHGADVNAQSENGFTALYMAAQENHVAVVTHLLGTGANQAIATEDGFTPLAVALQQAHERVVELLLEGDARGRVRLPALHIAARKDDTRSAALLLHSGTNGSSGGSTQQQQQPESEHAKSGFTPLHIAAHYGNVNVARLLLECGADPNYMANNGISPLHVAAKRGHSELVTLLLSQGGNIDARTRDGLTPLHCAARSGHDGTLEILLEQGAPILAKTKNGLSPLHMAAQGDHVGCVRGLGARDAPVDDATLDSLTALHVAAHCGHYRSAKLLLELGAEPDARALNGFTPLHIASKKNRARVVELLLRHRATIGAVTESGLTPLHVAAFMGNLEVVSLLLQYGATLDTPNVRGETPLHMAARAGQLPAVKSLLKAGADPHATTRDEQTALHLASRLPRPEVALALLEAGARTDAVSAGGYTPLHISARAGHTLTTASLLHAGADHTLPTRKGFTPLHVAAKYGQTDVVRLLLEGGAQTDITGKNGLTPLHVAAHYDHQEVALVLLQNGASPTATAKNGYTPLHIASRKGQDPLCLSLLSHGADVDAHTHQGVRALHLCSQQGHGAVCSTLLTHGAQHTPRTTMGLTPMHLAAQEDRVEVAQQLEAHGAAIDPVTKLGYTPLIVACHYGNAPMVEFLLRNGADVNHKTKSGYTPLHQAAQQGHTHIVSLLLKHGARPDDVTNGGNTALSIANRLGYISVVDTLQAITTETQTVTMSVSQRHRLSIPETMTEMLDVSDDDAVKYSERVMLILNCGGENRRTRRKIHVTMGKVNMQTPNIQQQALESRSNPRPPVDDDVERAMMRWGTPEHWDNVTLSSSPMHSGFLVSFLVDARGGSMRGCRPPGLRLLVPPGACASPTRVTCRLAKQQPPATGSAPGDTQPQGPPVVDGEGLAARIIQLGPPLGRFLGPVLLEAPHYASLRGGLREVVVLRSDDGATWAEHKYTPSDEELRQLMAASSEDLEGESPMLTRQSCRVLTKDFPKFLALVSRVTMETGMLGPQGGALWSRGVPGVRVAFPEGALTRQIRLGLQAQAGPDAPARDWPGNRVTFGPVVTLEPRRRKFHRPITVTMPLPQPHGTPAETTPPRHHGNLRLLCSIAGGVAPAVWEDITDTTPLTVSGDSLTFQTSVSARFWPVLCTAARDAPALAPLAYGELSRVPYLAHFRVWARRHDADPRLARLSCACACEERDAGGGGSGGGAPARARHTQLARSKTVEVLDGAPLLVSCQGNLTPLTPRGQGLSLPFHAFRENRLSFGVKVRDPSLEPCGRLCFYQEPRTADATPVCSLNITLPPHVRTDTVTHTHTHAYVRTAVEGNALRVHASLLPPPPPSLNISRRRPQEPLADEDDDVKKAMADSVMASRPSDKDVKRRVEEVNRSRSRKEMKREEVMVELSEEQRKMREEVKLGVEEAMSLMMGRKAEELDGMRSEEEKIARELYSTYPKESAVAEDLCEDVATKPEERGEDGDTPTRVSRAVLVLKISQSVSEEPEVPEKTEPEETAEMVVAGDTETRNGVEWVEVDSDSEAAYGDLSLKESSIVEEKEALSPAEADDIADEETEKEEEEEDASAKKDAFVYRADTTRSLIVEDEEEVEKKLTFQGETSEAFQQDEETTRRQHRHKLQIDFPRTVTMQVEEKDYEEKEAGVTRLTGHGHRVVRVAVDSDVDEMLRGDLHLALVAEKLDSAWPGERTTTAIRHFVAQPPTVVIADLAHAFQSLQPLWWLRPPCGEKPIELAFPPPPHIPSSTSEEVGLVFAHFPACICVCACVRAALAEKMGISPDKLKEAVQKAEEGEGEEVADEVEELGLSKEAQKAFCLLKLWAHREGNRATGTQLERYLVAMKRPDVAQVAAVGGSAPPPPHFPGIPRSTTGPERPTLEQTDPEWSEERVRALMERLERETDGAHVNLSAEQIRAARRRGHAESPPSSGETAQRGLPTPGTLVGYLKEKATQQPPSAKAPSSGGHGERGGPGGEEVEREEMRKRAEEERKGREEQERKRREEEEEREEERKREKEEEQRREMVKKEERKRQEEEEERKREKEEREMEEKKKEERKMVEEERKRLEEEMERVEEEMRMEEQRKREEEEEMKRLEEEMKRVEEEMRMEEQKKREMKRVEEEKRKKEEERKRLMKKKEEEEKREEQRKREEMKREKDEMEREEQKKREEERVEEEKRAEQERRKREEERKKEEMKRLEEEMKREEQRKRAEEEMKRAEEEMKREERKREMEKREEQRKKEERKRLEEEEEERRKKEEMKRVEEEERKRVEEKKRVEEQRKKKEEQRKKEERKRVEEEMEREEEMKRLMKKKEEIKRVEEEMKRVEEEIKRDQERKMEMRREVERVPPAPLAREEPRGDEEDEDEEGAGQGEEGSPAIAEGRLGAIPEEVEPVEGNEVSGRILSRGGVEVVEEEDEEMSPDEGSPVEEEVSRALGSRETTSSSDEEELVTTRVIRRRVIIKGEDVTDMPTDSVTEEQFTDEFGNIVTRKVTRKIIRRILSPETGPTTGGGLLDPSCHGQPGPAAAPLTVGSSPGTQRGAAEVSDSGGDAAPTTADAGGRERRAEGGDDARERRSHVYKRTVVHADERHSGVLLTECSGGEAVLTRAVSDSVVTGSHAERRHGDPTLTMDLSGAHLDFQQALLYAGAPPHVGDVDLLESTETVNPDGSTTTRTRMRKSTSREHSRTRAPKASTLERPGEDSSG